MVPVQHGARVVPGFGATLANGVGQHDRARIGIDRIAKGTRGLEIDRGARFKIDPEEIARFVHHTARRRRTGSVLLS